MAVDVTEVQVPGSNPGKFVSNILYTFSPAWLFTSLNSLLYKWNYSLKDFPIILSFISCLTSFFHLDPYFMFILILFFLFIATAMIRTYVTVLLEYQTWLLY